MTSQPPEEPEENGQNQQNQSQQPTGAPPQIPGARRRWADIVEQRIAEARERGDFDNLPGEGKPQRLEQNPFAGEKALAYSLLKNNDMAPPEIERGKEVAEDMQRAEALLVKLRHQRDRLRMRATVFASDRRTYNLLRDNTERRYAEAVRAINSKILSLNIIAPAVFHQRMIDVEAKLRAFQEEFPPLPE
jgi:DnaJ family protein C protein 28